MRYFYIVLIVAVVLLILFLLVFLAIKLRMKWAKKRVNSMSMEEKEDKLNEALSSFGFLYEEKDDSISSGMYPWQREMGYCRAYDEAALSMYMVFDCEPIYFTYNGKRYLIELWKGQYGCTTGAEIGVYVNNKKDEEKAPEDLFYECVSDEERLPMSFILRREGRIVLRRKAVHWWLTGFEVGMFSYKDKLQMEVSIVFPNRTMCRAFYEGLIQAGYEPWEITVEATKISFVFGKPRTRQPDRYPAWYRYLVNRRNRKNCKLYCRVTKPFESTLDRISYIGYCFPILYHTIIRIGTKGNSRKFRKYRKKMQKSR